MSDLVQRLRAPVDPDDPNLWMVDKNRLEAADCIEALEAALRRLVSGYGEIHDSKAVEEIARAALAPEQDK